MKTIIHACAAVLLCAASLSATDAPPNGEPLPPYCATARFGTPAEGLELGAAAPEAPLNAAAPSGIFVCIHNITAHDMVIFTRDRAELDYDISLKDPGGRDIPLTVQGVNMRMGRGIVYHQTNRTLKSGEQYAQPLNLGTFFDLRNVAPCILVLGRNVPRLDGNGWSRLESSPLVLSRDQLASLAGTAERHSSSITGRASTMLPVRANLQAMGATVDWFADEHKAVGNYQGRRVTIWSGRDIALVGARRISMGASAELRGGALYAPAAFLSMLKNSGLSLPG